MKFMQWEADGTSDSPQGSVGPIGMCRVEHGNAIQGSEKHFMLLVFQRRPGSTFPRAKNNCAIIELH